MAAAREDGNINDDFIRDLVTILAEERLAMAVKNPLAFTCGDFAELWGKLTK